MAPEIVLCHRKTTKREGTSVLLGGSLTVIGLLGFLHLFFPQMRTKDPVFYYLFVGVTLLIGILLIGFYAIPNLRMDREFCLTITKVAIECKSPSEWFCESYYLPLDEVTQIEQNNRGESREWYLHTLDKRRIQLTPNYGNPCLDIIDTLMELKPDLEIVIES